MALARFSQEPPSEVYQDSTFTFAVQSPIDQFHRIGINQKNSFALAIVESAQYIEVADDPPARGMPQKGDMVSIFTNRYEREFRFELAITAVGTFNAVVRIYKYRAAAQDGVDCVGTVRSRLIMVYIFSFSCLEFPLLCMRPFEADLLLLGF